jgi:predicted MPP superfamily phosphohydrolase
MSSDSEVETNPAPARGPAGHRSVGAQQQPERSGAPPSLNKRFAVRALTRLGIAVTLLAGLHYYIGARLIGGAGLRGGGMVAAWFALWLLLASVPLGFLSWRFFPRWVARPIRAISHVWIGLFGLMLSSIVVTDAIRLLVDLFGATPADRLKFGEIQAMTVLAVVGFAGAIGFRTARGPARVERLRFPVPRLGSTFEGFRIAQISDLHITEHQDPRILARVIEQVNALQPDLVAITGDLVDGHVDDLRPHVAPLSSLRAKEGVFFVTGNHEYYHGADAWSDEVRRLGIVVLHNEHRVLRRGAEGLVVAGVTDYDGGQFHPHHESRPDLALDGAPDDFPRILLAHQPRSAAHASNEMVDLQLSGHTHGGQIFPFMFFVRMQQPVVSGLKKLYGLWVYTSRGTGYWGPPFRVGPAPEITQIELIGASSSRKLKVKD